MLGQHSTKYNRSSQPERSVDGKIIGNVCGDTFIKNVIYEKHHMRTPPGWAIDAAAVSRMQSKGEVKQIEIRDRESKRTWRCSLDKFLHHAIEKNYPGYGKQLLLLDVYWIEVHPDGQGSEQLRLF